MTATVEFLRDFTNTRSEPPTRLPDIDDEFIHDMGVHAVNWICNPKAASMGQRFEEYATPEAILALVQYTRLLEGALGYERPDD